MGPKVEHGQDNLRCELTDHEVLDYGKRQARLLSDRDRVADELKAFSTESKNKTAVIEAEINTLSERIRNGYEFRFVPTTITTDWEAELVSFTRDDTGKVYRQRPLNAEERQLVLDVTAEGADVLVDEHLSPSEVGQPGF